jgi:hypothetical protein
VRRLAKPAFAASTPAFGASGWAAGAHAASCACRHLARRPARLRSSFGETLPSPPWGPSLRIDAQVALLGKDAKAAAAALLPDLQQFITSFEAHLRSEEDHMQPIGRRYLPLAAHKQITAKVRWLGAAAGCSGVPQDTAALPAHDRPAPAPWPAPLLLQAALDAAWALAAPAPAGACR